MDGLWLLFPICPGCPLYIHSLHDLSKWKHSCISLLCFTSHPDLYLQGHGWLSLSLTLYVGSVSRICLVSLLTFTRASPGQTSSWHICLLAKGPSQELCLQASPLSIHILLMASRLILLKQHVHVISLGFLIFCSIPVFQCLQNMNSLFLPNSHLSIAQYKWPVLTELAVTFCQNQSTGFPEKSSEGSIRNMII